LVCDNGLDDDGDQLIDYPEDDGCDDLLDLSEVPEPDLPVALAAGVMALLAGAHRRPLCIVGHWVWSAGAQGQEARRAQQRSRPVNQL
jgi:hypothetical protein